MIPILFDVTATDYTKGWICFLTEAITCLVTEKASGEEYALKMTYPVTGNNFAEIITGRLIVCTHDDYKDLQPFRIQEISKPINGIVTVEAYHKSYDLAKNVLMPFRAENTQQAIDGLNAHVSNYCGFRFSSDIETGVSFSITTPRTIRSGVIGAEGSFVDTYGGEIEWDADEVRINKARGKEKDLVFRQSVNITDVKLTDSIENTYTGIVPYCKDSDGEVMTLPESAVSFADMYFANTSLADLYIYGVPDEMYFTEGTLTDEYDDEITDNSGEPFTAEYIKFTRTVPVDLSDKFEDSEKEVSETDLREAAKRYLINNATFFFENFSCKINNLDEHGKVLEPIGLYDTVKIYYKKYHATAKKKIVALKYDVLHDRAKEIEVGYEKSTFASTLMELIRKAKR